MILYKAKTNIGRLILKRYIRVRGSDKDIRIHNKLYSYRKTWWHFRTRWDPVDNDNS